MEQEFGGRKEKLNHSKNKLLDMKYNFKQYKEVNEIKITEEQIERFLLDKEVYWKQIVRADWLKEEDKNIKLFSFKSLLQKKEELNMGSHEQVKCLD